MADIAQREQAELKEQGADTRIIDQYRAEISKLAGLLKKIDEQHDLVVEYRKDEKELLSQEPVFKEQKKKLEADDQQLQQAFALRTDKLEKDKADKETQISNLTTQLAAMADGLTQYEQLCAENGLPQSILEDDSEEKTDETCSSLVSQMRGNISGKRQKQDELKRAVNAFNTYFDRSDTFHFPRLQYDEDYLTYAGALKDFVDNNKIEEYRLRVSDHYNRILESIAREVSLMMDKSASIKGIIHDLNHDFRENNFAGVIRSIELRAQETSDPMMQLMKNIRDFTIEHELAMGPLNLFSEGDREQANAKAVDLLKKFMRLLQKESNRQRLTLSDTFRLEFQIQENDNNTGWVERINNVGSDGTDVLVKAMVNIMLINVFKKKASRRKGDFILHCMMDEIGKLHPSNVAGILQFANVRNIYLINSSPMGYNSDIYKYNYLLTKDDKSKTRIKRLTTIDL